MQREDVSELHYIAPIENLSSILSVGLLSHHKARFITHGSVADPEVQARRSRKAVPAGKQLHRYVNLYFNARNPMLFRRRDQHTDIVVLAIRPEVLDLPGVFITDGNAANVATAFMTPTPINFALLDADELHAEYWSRENMTSIEREEARRRRCAEVLVPNHVNRSYIDRVYCSCDASRERIVLGGCTIDVVKREFMFFLPRERS